MAEYRIQGTTLTAIADAIRAKNGTADKLDPQDYADEITALPTGGGGDPETEELYNALYNRSVTDEQCIRIFKKSKDTKVADFAFAYCNGLKNLVFDDTQKVTRIGQASFVQCGNLKSVEMAADSKINRLDTQAFLNCINLESVVFSKALNYMNYSFYGCSALKTVKFRSPCPIKYYDFQGCTALELWDFSEVEGDTLPALTATASQMNSWSKLKVLVPVGWMRSMKQAADWATHKDRIICKQGESATVEAHFGLDLDTHMTLYINGVAYDHCDNLESSDIFDVQCIGLKYDDGCSGGVIRLNKRDSDESILLNNEQDVVLPSGSWWTAEIISNASDGNTVVADCEYMSEGADIIELHLLDISAMPVVSSVDVSVQMDLEGYEGNTYRVTVDSVDADAGVVYLDATTGDAQQLYNDYDNFGTVTLTFTFEDLVYWWTGGEWILIPSSSLGVGGDYMDNYEGHHDDCGTTFYYYGDTEANCPVCGAPFISNADTGDNVEWL